MGPLIQISFLFQLVLYIKNNNHRSIILPVAIISGYTISYLFPSKSIAFKWAKNITQVLAFLLPSMHCKDVGRLGKENLFKPRMEFDVIWGPDAKSDSSRGNVSFYFVRVWYGPVMSINKAAPADTEKENVLETVLSLCHNKLFVFNWVIMGKWRNVLQSIAEKILWISTPEKP